MRVCNLRKQGLRHANQVDQNRTSSCNMLAGMHNKQPSEPVAGKAPSEWHDRKYTEDDFALLEKQLKDDDEDFRPTPQQLESLKSHYLHKRVGAIQYHIALGRAPPDNWVELSLYNAAYDWMERCP